MTIADKLKTTLDTKNAIKQSLENKDVDTNGVPFTEYPRLIDEMESGGGDYSIGDVVAPENIERIRGDELTPDFEIISYFSNFDDPASNWKVNEVNDDDNGIYFIRSNNLYKCDIFGKILFEKENINRVYFDNAGEYLYVVDYKDRGSLSKLDLDGNDIWKIKLTNANYEITSVSASKRYVSVGINDTTQGRRGLRMNIYDVDGKYLWTRNVTSVAGAPWTKVDEHDNFYVYFQQYGVYAYDSSGKLLWRTNKTYPSITISYEGDAYRRDDDILRKLDSEGAAQWQANVSGLGNLFTIRNNFIYFINGNMIEKYHDDGDFTKPIAQISDNFLEFRREANTKLLNYKNYQILNVINFASYGNSSLVLIRSMKNIMGYKIIG